MAQPGLSEIDKAVEREKATDSVKAVHSVRRFASERNPGATEQITSSQSSKPRAQNPNLVKAPVGKIGMSGIGTGSTSRSKQYLQDIKDKREEGSKIPDIKFTILFDDGERIDTALDAVVTKAQEYFAESFPTSPKVYRHMVTFYAALTTANISRLGATETTTGTALGLLRTNNTFQPTHTKTSGYIFFSLWLPLMLARL
ncbi:hypothetical protein R3P38DRAFT_3231858 [Favolaschia claudopus]|uniref:Uncharacterized protein n=1 Tax=Favolaschia claudopus TaxID=2862362 RepID=A0AAV9ZJK9_9AGAR